MVHRVMDASSRRKALKQFEKVLARLEGASANSKTVREGYLALKKFHWSRERYQRSGWAHEADSLYNLHIDSVFGDRPFDSLTRKEVRAWHQSLHHIPTSANRALSVLSKTYKYAIEQEWTEINPCFGIQTFTERKRKRVATLEEIAAIGTILKGYIADTRMGKAFERKQAIFLYALMVTGARPRSLEHAVWGELKVQGSVGILSFAGKTTSDTGDDESVIFPASLLELIGPQGAPLGSIFGVEMPTTLWKRIRRKVGCPDLWARDFRRTFATMGLSSGISIDLIGEVLNHKSAHTTKLYAKAFAQTKTDTSVFIADQITALF